MGWQADDEPGPGEAPGEGGSLPELLAGFEHGGAWDAAAPSAGLATALETAAGPRELYEGAEAGALVGIARQWAAIESWAAAGTLAALRAMTREDGEGRPLTRRRADLPDGWDDRSTTRSPPPSRWGRSPPGTSPPWPGRWACGCPASGGSCPAAPSPRPRRRCSFVP